MKQDDILMNKIIQEAGLLSRASARARSLGGAIRQGVGDVATAAIGKKPASDAGWRGKYTSGKQDRILDTLSNDIINDLRKLNVVPKGSPINTREIKNMLTQYVSKYSGVGKQQQAQQSQTNAGSNIVVPRGSSTPAATASTPEPETSTPEPETSTAEPETSTASSTPSWRDVWNKGADSQTTTQDTQQEEPEEEEEIPNETKIQDKKGNVYEYDSEDKKWYMASKAGGSTSQIPNDSDVIQNAISKAWRTKSQKEKEAAKEPPVFESFKNFFWKD